MPTTGHHTSSKTEKLLVARIKLIFKIEALEPWKANYISKGMFLIIYRKFNLAKQKAM